MGQVGCILQVGYFRMFESYQHFNFSDALINGRVEYAVKMLGQIEVQEPKGTHIVRDAIHAIRFHLQVKRGETGHSGAKLRKVTEEEEENNNLSDEGPCTN